MPPPDPLNKGPALHSRYNPRGEAERYIEALKPGPEVQYFILIEPGLGYLVPVLRERRPGAKIIALHLDHAFRAAAGESGVPAWFPGEGTELRQFLEDQIPDTEARFVRLVEWRPSLRVYGEKYLGLLSEAAEFIRRIDANSRTARNFGRRWLKNFFKNLGLLRTLLRPRPFGGSLVITGAGPSLEETIPLRRDMKKTAPLFVLAASSSAGALIRGGISPDLLISTDSGPWALVHLRELRRGEAPPPPLAANLCAALPSQCAGQPVMALNDGSVWQSLVLRGLGIPFALVPQRGTVSASALDLALLLCPGNIFITGMDLAVRDIKTHARPYGFDPLFWGRASRFEPFYSQTFCRAGEISRGGSHDIYAAWFQRQIAAWPERIYSLGRNSPVFQGLKGGNGDGGRAAEKTGGPGVLGDSVPVPPGTGPREAAEILARALEAPALAPALTGELAPLLFPRGPRRAGASPGELAEELRALARPYAEAGGG
jgi:hypothetical protein